MTIRRSARTVGYTVLDNSVFTPGMSFEAIGLLCYLLSKPDHWQVSVQQLINFTKGSERSSGRDKVRGLINELILKGFILRQTKRAAGKLDGFDYVVFDRPQSPAPDIQAPETPAPENPAPVLPATDLPAPAETPLVNTDVVVTTESKARTELPPASPPATMPPTAPVEAVDEEGLLQAACRLTWAAFKRARIDVYGAPPLRDKAINSMVKKFVQRVGMDVAPDVAEFYVRRVKDAFVVRNCHPVEQLLKNADAYHSQWASGRAMTNTRARQIDQTNANMSAAQEAAELALAMRRSRERSADAQR